MTEIRPLYFFGQPTDEQREALRKGKELLGVDWLVQPVEVTVSNPPEGPVLCFATPPFFFAHGFALLSSPFTPARMATALEEVLGLTPGDYLTTPEEWLSELMGCPVKVFYGDEV